MLDRAHGSLAQAAAHWLLLDLGAADRDLDDRAVRSRRRRAETGRATVRVPRMSTQVVVAKLAGLTGRAAELRQLLAGRAADVRAEDGCAGYEVAELLGEPARS